MLISGLAGRGLAGLAGLAGVYSVHATTVAPKGNCYGYLTT
jgi:hypothetical protein